MYKNYIKRLTDIALSFICIVILLPFFLIIAIAIKLDSPGPVFFKQKRIGIHKSYFVLYKFRTMRSDSPQDMPTHLLTDPAKWITRTGRFLRKSSLDELPNIWSILFGKMSLIGPRPALWNQSDLIEERDKYGANDIRPGLTGWAQINGRDELPIDVKARYDGEYVKKMSFLFDCKCFFGTFWKVLKRDGVVEGQGETHEQFLNGNSETMKLVSVIMPAYNCERYICEAIESVMNQEYAQWELIAVDDCSTDGTKKVIERYVQNDPRIRLISLKGNKGAANARNIAVEAAKGAYIAFLDSDDCWVKAKLKKQISFMENNGYTFTFTSYNKIGSEGEELGRTIRAAKRLDYEGVLKRSAGNSTVIYNAEILGKFQIPLIRKRNDYVMWLMVIKAAKVLHGLDEVLSSHRVWPGTISSNKIALISYHWKVYREIEKLPIPKSFYLVCYWIFFTVFKLR